MKNTVVAKRYAEALFEVASAKGNAESAGQDLGLIANALQEHPQLMQILAHPSIPQTEKKQQLTTLFSGRVSDIVLNLVQLLVDRRRQDDIATIHTEYVRLADAAAGRVKATLETAVPLSEEELTALKNQLGKNGQQVELTTKVNPALIGGARVRLGDRVFEYSVANQLDRFRQSLKY
jgi:F-type H+-transporting ATPase subunit delta